MAEDFAKLNVFVDLAQIIKAMEAGNREVLTSFERWEQAARAIDFDPSSDSAKKLRNEVKQSTADFDSLSDLAVDTLRRQIPAGANASERAMEELEAALEDSQREVTDLRNKVTRFGKSSKQSADRSTRSFQRLNSAFSRLKGLIAAAGITIGLNQIVDASKRQDLANRLLEQSLSKNEIQSTRTAESFREQAAALQQVTNFGDEAIQEIQALILRYQNLNDPEIVDRAIQNTLDMAAAGKDLTASAETVAKALNNPAKRIGELVEQGLNFNEQQIEQIRLLQANGNLFEAQTKVLEVLEAQYEGTAEAARGSLSGSLQSLGNVMGDLLEQVGEGGLNAALTETAERLTDTVLGSESAAEALGEDLGTAIGLVTNLLITLSQNSGFAAASIAGIMAPGVIARFSQGNSQFVKLINTIRVAEGASGKLNAFFSSGLGIGVAVAAAGSLLVVLNRLANKQAQLRAETVSLGVTSEEYAKAIKLISLQAKIAGQVSEERLQGIKSEINAVKNRINTLKLENAANEEVRDSVASRASEMNAASKQIKANNEVIEELTAGLKLLEEGYESLTGTGVNPAVVAQEKLRQKNEQLTEAEQELILALRGSRNELEIRTAALLRAISNVRSTGVETEETNRRISASVKTLVDDWRTFGGEVPEDLRRVAESLGVVSSETERLRDLQESTIQTVSRFRSEILAAMEQDALDAANAISSFANQTDNLGAAFGRARSQGDATEQTLQKVRVEVGKMLLEFERAGTEPPEALAKFAEAVGATADSVQEDLKRQEQQIDEFVNKFKSGTLEAGESFTKLQETVKETGENILSEQQKFLQKQREQIESEVRSLEDQRADLQKQTEIPAFETLEDFSKRQDAEDELRKIDRRITEIKDSSDELDFGETFDSRPLVTAEEAFEELLRAQREVVRSAGDVAGSQARAQAAIKEGSGLYKELAEAALESGLQAERGADGVLKITDAAARGSEEAQGLKEGFEGASSEAGELATEGGKIADSLDEVSDAEDKLKEKSKDRAKTQQEALDQMKTTIDEILEGQEKVTKAVSEMFQDLRDGLPLIEKWGVEAERVRSGFCGAKECAAQL